MDNFNSNYLFKEIKLIQNNLGNSTLFLFIITKKQDQSLSLTKCFKINKYSNISDIVFQIMYDVSDYYIRYNYSDEDKISLFFKYRLFTDLSIINHNIKLVKNHNLSIKQFTEKYIPNPIYILKSEKLGIIKESLMNENNHLKEVIVLNQKLFLFLEKIHISNKEFNIKIFKNNHLISEFTDFITDEFIRRTIKQHHYYYDFSGKLIKIENIINIQFINKMKTDYIQNCKFLTFDIESYFLDENQVPYACGYYNGKYIKLYYLTNYNSHQEMLQSAFKDILKYYSRHIVYVHNLRHYDSIFILNCLLTDEFKLKPVYKDGKLYSLKISGNIDGKYRNIILYDSLLLLPGTLRILAKKFNVKTQKAIFPYRFVTKDKLDYKGKFPDIKFYEDIDNLTYNKMIKSKTIFNLKNETLNYLTKDLESLYQIIQIMSNNIFNKFRLNIIDFPTLPSLAMGIFRSNFYNEEVIPKLKGFIATDIRNAYFGGRTEVFKPILKQGKAYDVNSLYSDAMLNDMPVGKPILSNDSNLNNYFGFVYAIITTPKNSNIGLLPYRNLHGELFYPLGNFSGWYFSEELKYAEKHGYKIEILKGYKFKRGINIFKDYVNYFYEIKSYSQDIEKVIAKLFLNSLYGKFGQKPTMEQTTIVSQDELKKYLVKYEILDEIELNSNYSLIRFNNKLIVNEIDDNFDSNLNVSIGIAAAVTSYARIFMNDYLTIPNNPPYYTDTDSVYLPKPLPDFMVSSTELGKMKLEHEFEEALFIAPKLYLLKTKNKTIIKSKGTKSLTYKDFLRLYYGESVTVFEKR